MMKELKGEGCKVYLISASAEFYLNELYNIKDDPLETKNILNSEKKISKKLKNKIIEHLKFVKNHEN